MKLNFIVQKDLYAIYRLKPDSKIPESIHLSEFYSLTRTKDELSVVCNQSSVAATTEINKDWKIIKVAGPLDFSLVGIIAEISGILKKSNIPIFTISTFDTDYILVKDYNLHKAMDALKVKGHDISFEE